MKKTYQFGWKEKKNKKNLMNFLIDPLDESLDWPNDGSHNEPLDELIDEPLGMVTQPVFVVTTAF